MKERSACNVMQILVAVVVVVVVVVEVVVVVVTVVVIVVVVVFVFVVVIVVTMMIPRTKSMAPMAKLTPSLLRGWRISSLEALCSLSSVLQVILFMLAA